MKYMLGLVRLLAVVCFVPCRLCCVYVNVNVYANMSFIHFCLP